MSAGLAPLNTSAVISAIRRIASPRLMPKDSSPCIEQQAALEDGKQRRVHFGLGFPLLAPVLDPDRGLVHVEPDPDHDEGRQYPDPQQASPPDQVEQDAVGERRYREAKHPRALQHAAHEAE